MKISKVLKTCINEQLILHLEKNHLTNDYQDDLWHRSSIGVFLAYVTWLWISIIQRYGEDDVRVWHDILFNKLPSYRQSPQLPHGLKYPPGGRRCFLHHQPTPDILRVTFYHPPYFFTIWLNFSHWPLTSFIWISLDFQKTFIHIFAGDNTLHSNLWSSKLTSVAEAASTKVYVANTFQKTLLPFPNVMRSTW